jgi:hypothetical protein
MQPATLVSCFFGSSLQNLVDFPTRQIPRCLTSFDVVYPRLAPHSSNSPRFVKILFKIEKKKEKNSIHNKWRNKSKKTIVPVVEECEDRIYIDLGVEDDHHSGIQSIPFERWTKLT